MIMLQSLVRNTSLTHSVHTWMNFNTIKKSHHCKHYEKMVHFDNVLNTCRKLRFFFYLKYRPGERPGPAARDLAFSVQAGENCYQQGPNDRIKFSYTQRRMSQFLFYFVECSLYISSEKTFPPYLQLTCISYTHFVQFQREYCKKNTFFN